MSLIVERTASVKYLQVIAVRRSKSHQLVEQESYYVLVDMLTIENVFQHTGFCECNRTFVLMDLVFLKVEFKYGYLDKILCKVPIHKSSCKLVALWLFCRLTKLVVRLIKDGELTLVHHSEIGPELDQLACSFDRTLPVSGC